MKRIRQGKNQGMFVVVTLWVGLPLRGTGGIARRGSHPLQRSQKGSGQDCRTWAQRSFFDPDPRINHVYLVAPSNKWIEVHFLDFGRKAQKA